MALYYGKHKVRDYEAWRPYFDDDQERIKRTGAKLVNVMRSAEDPNEVHFLFDIPDFDAFMGTLNEPGTMEIMERAGVLESPVLYRLSALVPEAAEVINN
jgi:hypothetical protein